MPPIKPTRYGSYLVGSLPEGCRLCTMGAKLVLFVTGLCPSRCFYCPLSPERKGMDRVYANERPVTEDKDILAEARIMDALGTGLTGGDPLAVPDRTVRMLSLLKSEFGQDHHIHLYTSSSHVPSGLLTDMRRSGLDEIRFHATPAHREVLQRACRVGLNVGVEIPSMPGRLDEMMRIAAIADQCGCRFLNLNELEICETTAPEFKVRGLRTVSDESMAIEGSLEEAIRVAEFCEAETALDVHVCPSSLKDSVQLRNRLGRIAERVRKPYEEIDEDNLLVRTVVTARTTASAQDMRSLAERLRRELSLSSELLVYEESRGRIETLPSLAERIAELVEEAEIEVALTEEYPTHGRLETERHPVR